MKNISIVTIFKKIELRGVSWFLSRCLQETECGTSWSRVLFKPLMIVIYWTILYPINKFKLFSLTKNSPYKSLYREMQFLFYDFEVSPITFDFAWALVLAENERKKRGLNKLYVVFVPGKTKGLRKETPEYEEKIDVHARYWRRNEVLYTLCQLLPTCAGMTFCSTREEASLLWQNMQPNIFPNLYTTLFPISHCVSHGLINRHAEIMSLHATEQAKRYIQQWLEPRIKNRKLVTITLRNSAYMPVRNSNLKAWATFAKKLDSNEYFIIFLPDTDDALNEPPEELAKFTFFTEPAWNLNLRAALYEMSYLNLGVNNGVMALCWLNAKCRYITFKMIVAEAPQTTQSSFLKHGYKIGKSLPFANPMQKWAWDDDDADTIEHEFQNMCRIIDTTSGSIIDENCAC